jgi:hypothetical protein
MGISPRVVGWFGRAAVVVVAVTVGWAVGTLTAGSAWATYADSWQLAIQQGFNTQGTAGASTDKLIGMGYWDGTNWQRTNAGVLGGGGYTSDNFNQEALSTTSEAIPATALTGRVLLRVYNQDTAINVFCKDGAAATSTNGVLIEPRTGRPFPTTGTVQCIAASGTPTVDYEEYAP